MGEPSAAGNQRYQGFERDAAGTSETGWPTGGGEGV